MNQKPGLEVPDLQVGILKIYEKYKNYISHWYDLHCILLLTILDLYLIMNLIIYYGIPVVEN